MANEVYNNDTNGNDSLDSRGLCRRCSYRRAGLFLGNAWRAVAVLLLAGLPCYWAWLQAVDRSWHLSSEWAMVYGTLALGSIALAFGVKPALPNNRNNGG